MARPVALAGEEILAHHASGEIVVRRVEGRAASAASEATRGLGPGRLVSPTAEAAHALRGIESASRLATILSGRGWAAGG